MSKATTTAKSDSASTSIEDEPEIVVTEARQATTIAVSDHADAFTGDKVELTINSGDGEVNRQAVFLGINGHSLNIPRDTPVIVAQEVLDQLKNCKMTVYESIDGGKMIEREVQRFSFTATPVRAK